MYIMSSYSSDEKKNLDVILRQNVKLTQDTKFINDYKNSQINHMNLHRLIILIP